MNQLSKRNARIEPLQILVVEDDFVFNAFYKNFLGSKGAIVTSCLSLAEAKVLLSERPSIFDAVILDNQLSDGEGISLIPFLTAQTCIPAIIMVSGNDDPEFFLNAFTAGIHDYMVKPVNMELLNLKLNKAVDQLRLSRLSAAQKAELELWVEQEQLQQSLAKHLFDSMFLDINEKNPAIHLWVKPSGVFSGDAMLRCEAADGSWYFVMADAMGHGLAPAISLMPLMQRFQMLATKATPLANIVFDLNGALNQLLPPDRFVASILIRINPYTNHIEVWNGGMPALQCLDINGQTIVAATSKNMALGVLSNDQINVIADQIPLNDIVYLLMHSDGLTETNLIDGNTLQSNEIASLLNLATDNPFERIDTLFNNVSAEDDISLCCIDCSALLNTTEHAGLIPYQSSGSFTADFCLHGSSLLQTDLPTKAVELLRAQQLPLIFVQRVFTVLTELFINALEHGVLGLESKIKELEDGFLQFYEEKERRLQNLSEQQFIQLHLHWSASEQNLLIKISDSGEGFLSKPLEEVSIQSNLIESSVGHNPVSYGRGIPLINKLSSHFEILAPGNCAVVTMSF